MNPTAPDPEELLVHSRFVRRVARALVRDEHHSEDVVQQTWLKALGAAPRDRSAIRSWLRRIVHNTARSLGREEERLSKRHANYSRFETEPSTAEVVEQTQTIRRVVQALDDLDESSRSVILLRYFHDRSAREIATMRDVPVATVRSQIQRALAKLRTRLDESGDRASWTTALFPIAFGASPPELAPMTGPIGRLLIMSTTTKSLTGSILLVMLTVAYVLWPSPDGPGVVPAVPSSVESVSEGADGDEPIVAVSASRSPLTESVDGVSTQESSVAEDVVLARLVVEARWEDGTSAQSVSIAVYPSALDSTSEVLETVWESTDDQGRAVFESLEASTVSILAQRQPDSVVEKKLEPGRNIVTLFLPHGRDLYGRVVDAHGAPVANAKILIGSWAYGLEGARTGEDGAFRLRSLSDASWISAIADGFLMSPAHSVAAQEPGVPLEIRLENQAVTLQGRVVDIEGAPIEGATVMSGWLISDFFRSESPPGVRSPPLEFTRTDKEGRFRLSGLSHHGANLWTGAPRYAATQTTVNANDQTTNEIVITLERGATIQGTVLDKEGNPVPHATLGIRDRTSPEPGMADQRPGWASHAHVTVNADGSFSVGRIPPGSVDVVASHRGDDRSAFAQFEVAAGETIDWNPVLDSMTLKGFLRDDTGEVLRGWRVRIEGPEGIASPISVTTDRDGLFELSDCCSTIAYQLKAWDPDRTWNQPALIETGLVPRSQRYEFVVPRSKRPSCVIKGTLTSHDGEELRDVHLVVRDRRDGSASKSNLRTGVPFEVGPIPPGSISINGYHEQRGWFPLGDFALSYGETLDLGSVSIPEPGRLEVTILGTNGALSTDAGATLAVFHRRVGSGESFPIVDGHAVAENLPPGQYTYRIFGSGPKKAYDYREIEVRSGETTEFTVREVPGVEVSVVYSIEGVEVPLWFESHWRDGNGRVIRQSLFRIWQPKDCSTQEVLAPGIYEIETVLPDGKKGRHVFEVSEIGQEPIVIRLAGDDGG